MKEGLLFLAGAPGWIKAIHGFALRAATPSRIAPGDPVEPGSHPQSPTIKKAFLIEGLLCLAGGRGWIKAIHGFAPSGGCAVPDRSRRSGRTRFSSAVPDNKKGLLDRRPFMLGWGTRMDQSHPWLCPSGRLRRPGSLPAIRSNQVLIRSPRQ